MNDARPDEPANLESVQCSACGTEFVVRGFTRGQVAALLTRHASLHKGVQVPLGQPQPDPADSTKLVDVFPAPAWPGGESLEESVSSEEMPSVAPSQSWLSPAETNDSSPPASPASDAEASEKLDESLTASADIEAGSLDAGSSLGNSSSGPFSNERSVSEALRGPGRGLSSMFPGESPADDAPGAPRGNKPVLPRSSSFAPPAAAPTGRPAGPTSPSSPAPSTGEAGAPAGPAGLAGKALPGAGASGSVPGADSAGSATPGGGYQKDIKKIIDSAQQNMTDPNQTAGEGLESTTRDAAKIGATAGTAAALQYASSGAIPEPVARKIAESKPVKAVTDKVADKAVTKGIRGGRRAVKGVLLTATLIAMPLLLIATMLVGAAVVSSTGNSSAGYLWDAPIDPEAMDIPPSYADAYYSTATRLNIPWTLLAAVGATSSYHGRVNPYLQPVPLPIPRTPAAGPSAGSTCSVSQPTQPGNPAAGTGSVPESQLTVSGHEALKAGDPRLVTFTVANRNITTHRDHQQTFTDFLNAWNQDPVLGRGRLNIDKGVGPVDSYEYRKARVTTNRWSDHAGYAIDIRYDLLPAFSGYQMTEAERAATRRLLERFPQLGWGGDYDLKYMDEMHFNIAPCAAWSTPSTSSGLSALYVIGDSLSDPKYGAASTHTHFEKAARTQGFSYVVYAAMGKSTQWGLSQIAANPPGPGASVVVAMGTNDAASASGARAFGTQVKKVMALLPTHTVYWVNVRHDPEKGFENVTGNDKTVNRILIEEQANFPNLRVLDWDSWSRSNGVSTVDGIHYSSDGYAERAQFIIDSLGSGSSPSPSTSPGGTTPVGAGVVPVELVGPGVLPTPVGKCPVLPKPIEGTSPLQGYGPLMLSPAALSRVGGEASTEQLQNICESTETLGAIISNTAKRVASVRGLSYPDSFRPLVESAKEGDAESAAYIESFWTSVMDAIEVVGGTTEPTCTISPMPSPSVGVGGVAIDATPDTTPRQDWIADAISDIWACELVNQPLRSVLRASWSGSSLQYTLASREQARARAIREAVEVAWLYSGWGEARHANRECKPDAPLAGVFPLSMQVFSENLPQRLAGANRCDVEANIVAAARAFRSGETVEPASRPGGSKGWQSLYGGWSKFENTVTGPDSVRDLFDSQGPWAPFEADQECRTAITEAFSSAAASPSNPLSQLTSAQVRSYLAGVGLSTSVLDSLDGVLDGLASEVSSSGACAVERDDQWLWVLQSGAAQTEQEVNPRHPRSPASVDDISHAMAKRLDERLNGPGGRATPSRDRTALLQRLSPVRLGSSVMPTPPPTPSGLGTGQGYVSIAVGVYGGFYAGGLGGSASGGFSGANCPQVAPDNTLRDGLDTVGVAEICRQAVSQAATPQAALAIQWVLSKGLGHAYPDPYDCSILQSTAYREGAGLDIVHTTRNMAPWGDVTVLDPHYQELTWEEARPGDLLIESTPSPSSEHVLMYLGVFLGQPTVAHTNYPGDISRVEFLPSFERLYDKPVRRVVPVTEKEKQAIANLSASLGGSAAASGIPGFTVPAAGTLLGKASQMKDTRPFAAGATNNSGSRMNEWMASDRTVFPGTPRAYAVEQLARFGWGLDQWPCLDRLWWHESGWNHLLQQQGGSGYGIPQATPGNRMRFVDSGGGPDWVTNPKTQINWGLTYISKYGWWESWQAKKPVPQNLRVQTPCGVWEVWRWRARPDIDGTGTY